MRRPRHYGQTRDLAEYLAVYMARLDGRLEAALARLHDALRAADADRAGAATRDVLACAIRMRRVAEAQRRVKEP